MVFGTSESSVRGREREEGVGRVVYADSRVKMGEQA